MFAQTSQEELCSHQKRWVVLQSQTNARLNFSQDLYNLMMLYDVKQYHLNLNVETNTTLIAGNVKFWALANNNISTFAFELHPNYTVSSVIVKNITHTGSAITRTNNEVRVSLISAIDAGEMFEAIINYSGNGPVDNSNPDAGFCQRTAPNGKKYTYTMSQPYGTADWMPVKQILIDKADSVKVYITTSSSNKVGSQGVLKQAVGVGGGKTRYEWESKYPTAYYLISFAVGEYVEYTLNANVGSNVVPIINYLYDNASVIANQANLNQTKLTLEKFSELFGDYPFKNEKYGHCQVPHSFYLENQTMSSMISFPNTVIAHELAHQWYGDALTLQSFSEIGFSEGFANYSEYLYREHFVSLASAQSTYQNWRNNVMSQPGGSVYLADSLNTTAMFDSRLIYQKGACLVHMMRYLVNNDALFYQALNSFTNTYQHQNITYNLFGQHFESITGINLTQDFLPQWFRGEGYPTYNITWNWKDGYLHIISNQTTSRPSVTPFFKMPFELGLTDVNGNTTIIRLAQNQNKQLHKIAIATPIVSVSFDPRIFLLAKNTLTRDNSLSIEFDAPQVVSFSPAHLAENVPSTTDLSLTFNENVFKNAGRITIRKEADGSIFQELDINASSVKVTGAKITIQAQEFEKDKTYFVEISPSAILDRYDNAFAGFSGNNTWRFSIEAGNLTAFNPHSFSSGIYPNPTTDWLYVGNAPSNRVEIFNVLGQRVGEYVQVSAISLAHLPKGIYLVQIIDLTGNSTHKLVKE
ncbi:MAG: M1 family aminopeptidase [Raineya sp.]